MARLLIAILLSLLRPIVVEAEAAVLAPDGTTGNRRPLMRSVEEHSFQLRPTGELVEDAKRSTEHDYCRDAYLLGKKNTNECVDGSKQQLIFEMRECENAATKANATEGNADVEKFLVGYNWTDLYPQGCFNSPKKHPTTGQKMFFYNPNGDIPTNPEKASDGAGGAYPICRRDRYLNGTGLNAGPDDSAGCPTDYERILDYMECKIMAGCSGRCRQEDYFSVGQHYTPVVHGPQPEDIRPQWAREYDNLPKGCFIREEDGCVYFNEPQADKPDPQKASGMPVCNVVFWQEPPAPSLL